MGRESYDCFHRQIWQGITQGPPITYCKTSPLENLRLCSGRKGGVVVARHCLILILCVLLIRVSPSVDRHPFLALAFSSRVITSQMV